jgi:hypothetical protein
VEFKKKEEMIFGVFGCHILKLKKNSEMSL